MSLRLIGSWTPLSSGVAARRKAAADFRTTDWQYINILKTHVVFTMVHQNKPTINRGLLACSETINKNGLNMTHARVQTLPNQIKC